MVEAGLARTAYEDSLHRRWDPARLEKEAGNLFQARIFPIPARGRKEIMLSYSQELGSRDPYVLPLAGLPRLDVWETAVWVDQGPGRQRVRIRFDRREATPQGDLVMRDRASVDLGTIEGALLGRR